MEIVELDAEAEVRSAYRWILGRDADPHGLEHYAGLLRSGEVEVADLREILLSSPEFWHGRSDRAVEERQAINDLVKRSTDMVVQTGPFAGMRMIDLSARG